MKKTVLTGLWIIISLVAIAEPRHVVVLQYHHFGQKTPPSTSITVYEFEQQLRYLQENNFSIWSLGKAIHHLQNKLPLPENCVVITIDDAYISIFTEAYPRLKKLGWPFTVFVATAGVDKKAKAFLSWEQMREMAKNGAEFAPHSHSHPYLVRNKRKYEPGDWATWARMEIQTSLVRLQKELGNVAPLFAYPFGEYDLALKKIVQELGLKGVGQHSGVVWPGSDFGALPRYPMSGPYANLKEFALKVNSLPLPVIEMDPQDPVLTEAMALPILKLKLAEGDYDLKRMACFASGQGRINLTWIDKKNNYFAVSPLKELPFGRSRYNCTAPHLHSKNYYWFSQQWLRLKSTP